MTDETLVFNGLDGSTGAYLLPPMPAKDFYREVIAEHFLADEKAHQAALQARVAQSEGHLGPPAGTDPQALDEVGWGIIFAHDEDPAIEAALKPLIDLRRAQAGPLFKIFRGYEGYRVGDTPEEYTAFLARHNMIWGAPDPERVPYYLLIVGSPERIPFLFQYMLDVQYAVGRIHFDTPAEYARYAASVVRAEEAQRRLPRRLVLAGTANPDDAPTELSATLLLPELERDLAKGPAAKGWTIELHDAERSYKANWLQLLGGAATPALLFTASHGVGFPNDPQRQQTDQGALVCQDWPGPFGWAGRPIPEDYYIAARDIGADAAFHGSIFFHFACYGAGTPRLDDYAHEKVLSKERQAIAQHASIAPLIRHMLAHPAGGPLAVIGHIDRAWPASFKQGNLTNTGGFRDTLRPLMRGSRIGFALESLNTRFAEIATNLTKELENVQFGKIPDPLTLSRLWMAHNDARGYIIVGDPAVRLELEAF